MNCPRCKKIITGKTCDCFRQRVNETSAQATERCQHELRMMGNMTRGMTESESEALQEREAIQGEIAR